MASAAVADTQSQDDVRKKKQLQEARAAGTAAPEMDFATGKIINPHNPMFITAAPWYLNQDKPSLQHQQAWNLKAAGTKDWYKRGTKGDVKTKFLKGACENCGATTHTKKDCVERPRKISAKKNGKNLMPDEFIEDLKLDYEGKRDRWNGYQPEDYQEVIQEWEKVEEARRQQKAKEQEERAKMKEKFKAQKKALKKKRKQRRRQLRRIAEGRAEDGTDTDATDSDANDSDTDTDTDSDSDASDDEDLGEKMKDFEKNTNAVATKDDKLRTTTRNLRIREDTAKYLLNLDVNSAFYDPKSRSMRQNPLAHLKEEEQGIFRGDNYVRNAGDTKKLMELTVFAWDAYKHGEKIHDFAQPTQAAKMHDIFKNRSQNLKETQQKELLDKYGGEEHMEAPREIIDAQNDNYVEYSRDGRVIKGRERAYEKSKYEEDVMVGNHTSVWGSYFDVTTMRFGYKCCKQCLKSSYCIPQKKQDTLADVPGESAAAAEGEDEIVEVAGQIEGSSSDSDSSSSGSASGDDAEKAAQKKAAADEKRKARALKGLKLANKEKEAHAPKSVADIAAAAAAAASADGGSKLGEKRSSAFGHVLEEITEFDQSKVDVARNAEKKRRKTTAQGISLEDERNRKYSSLAGDNTAGELSPEEYEAYRLERSRADDPMAQFG
jgi:pre-mRNA-processing factor SLU7